MNDHGVIYDCLAQRISAAANGISTNALAAIAIRTLATCAAGTTVAAYANADSDINNAKHSAIGNSVLSL